MSLRTAMISLTVLCLTIFVMGGLLALPPRTHRVRLGELRGIVFGPKEGGSIMGSTLAHKPTGYWAPTRRDLRSLEHRLQAYLWDRRPDKAEAFSGYVRQYYGFVRNDGRRILVVGFCADTTIDWRHDFVPAGEGTGCRFEAEYDLETDRVLHFWFSEE